MAVAMMIVEDTIDVVQDPDPEIVIVGVPVHDHEIEAIVHPSIDKGLLHPVVVVGEEEQEQIIIGLVHPLQSIDMERVGVGIRHGLHPLLVVTLLHLPLLVGIPVPDLALLLVEGVLCVMMHHGMCVCVRVLHLLSLSTLYLSSLYSSS